MKTSYNKSLIMKNAWKVFRNQSVRTMEMWSICLKGAWKIAKQPKVMLLFNKVYVENRKTILTYITYKLGRNNNEIAEDLCEDTFIKASKYLDTFDESKSKLSTWLHNIANCVIVDHIRAEKNRRNTIAISDYIDNESGAEWLQISSGDKTDEEVHNNETLESINNSLMNLKPKYQQIAQLYFVEEYSYNEIAQMLNIPLGNVKVLILRCRAMLQAELRVVGASYSLK